MPLHLDHVERQLAEFTPKLPKNGIEIYVRDDQKSPRR
jgi:hypothetical protein